MSWGSWLLWGFVATLVLTTIMAASQGLHMTRMSIPYMLGTVFTAGRDLAKLIGFLVHLVLGWAFSLLYIAAFQSQCCWCFGSIPSPLTGTAAVPGRLSCK